MRRETVDAAVSWQNALGHVSTMDVTFHGGEPLLPGASFYRIVLPLLREGLSPGRVRLSIQTNLWLITDELCEIFREHEVSIGTSLDGPEPINDAQRGEGYFRRTMTGIELLRKHGISVGCICTFTPQSAPRMDEIFDFFVREGLSFSIHAAVPSLQYSKINGWTLSPEDHGRLLVETLDRYLENLDRIRISTLDSLIRSSSAQHGGICTFGDCLGEHLAVGPEGDIFPCQRFSGMPEYRLGNVHDNPSLETLSASSTWRAFHDRQQHIEEQCGSCAYLDICRGGCPYNVLAVNGGSFNRTMRDPHCPAYRRIFSYIADRAVAEVFSEENLAAVVAEGASDHGLLRKGKLLQIMRAGPHPHQVAQQARRSTAAVALAVSDSPEEAVHKLDRAGLVTRPERATRSLERLQEHLRNQTRGLVNAYIHVTYACNLSCDHCYASSGPRRTVSAMAVEDVVHLIHEVASAGFAKSVITGGEPLIHPQWETLLDALAALKQDVKPLQTVLRTNLAYPMSPGMLERLAHSTDQVVVSVDGDEPSHDARRGFGTYGRTVANLRALLVAEPSTQVRLTAVLTALQISEREGSAVRSLAEELGVPVRFKPVLPIGRAAGMPITPEFPSLLLDEDSDEILAYQAHVVATCGLGMNLYIGPGGECFPCYALLGARSSLGNALDDGMAVILTSKRFRALKQHTVDSNRQCRSCVLRYLCGGFCRAWGNSEDPDAPATDCALLHERARRSLSSALESLDVSVERWLAAGLPLPEYVPQTE
jgi:uncharacterized protein